MTEVSVCYIVINFRYDYFVSVVYRRFTFYVIESSNLSFKASVNV